MKLLVFTLTGCIGVFCIAISSMEKERPVTQPSEPFLADLDYSGAGESRGQFRDARESLRNIQFLHRQCAQKSGAYLYQVSSVVTAAAEAFDLDVELILAVIVAESRCRSGVRSSKGAIGPMQLMPKTARWLGVKNPYRLQDNIFGGAKYLSYLLEKFDGDQQLAVAAYNAGPVPVRRYQAVPPYRETKKYVRQVMAFYNALTTKTRLI